jgi:hypothetical protein
VEGQDWKSFFRARAERPDLPGWDDTGRLTPEERRLIAPSIQQFQLGEGADGAGLRRRALESALAGADPGFIATLQLFIQEEQRHSRDLGRFLDREGIPRLERHWVDGVFRRVRRLAGLELCLTVLVTAEIIAVPYYKALGAATASPLLRAVCAQILADEQDHLLYQAFNLLRLRALRRRSTRCETACWRLFLYGTMLVVWREHRRVLVAGGYFWTRFRKECDLLLDQVKSAKSFQTAAGNGRTPHAIREAHAVAIPPVLRAEPRVR